MLSEAVIALGKKDYQKAIEQAKGVLSQSLSEVTAAHHKFAARSLARSFAALGRKSEAAKWKRISLEAGREKFLGDFLPNQIRSSLSQIEFADVTLTEQEMACLALSARGQTSADIAQKLGIKPRTVNFHFSKLLRKLNAVNRHEAIAKAFGANLLRR